MLTVQSYTQPSIKKEVWTRIQKQSKQQRHTLSDTLEIILEFYEKNCKEVKN